MLIDIPIDNRRIKSIKLLINPAPLSPWITKVNRPLVLILLLILAAAAAFTGTSTITFPIPSGSAQTEIQTNSTIIQHYNNNTYSSLNFPTTYTTSTATATDPE